MSLKKIMVCLDGSKNSIKGLREAIKLAKQTEDTLLGINSVTKFGVFTAIHLPKIPEKKGSKEARKVIKDAKTLVEKSDIDFECVVLAGHTSGYDLATFANNSANRIHHIVIGARGMGFPKELFFGSTSNFILHKARAPVTIVK
ncbi:MAG: universal stress protein [Thaumarchaeota archaeon]|nr:universal stress protein [Nitrososphaerota archaeon]